MTNAHVLRADDPPYRVQTPDGRIYPANLLRSLRRSKTDLALLQFRNASSIYTVASLGSSPSVGDEVFIGGFPFDEDGTQVKNFLFTPGKVSLILNKALEGGYQIGYTNLVKKGMSGGPLLNKQGEVIGINGMHAYPLWDIPSVFMDGSQADKDLHETINRLSWAVPMDTVLRVR